MLWPPLVDVVVEEVVEEKEEVEEEATVRMVRPAQSGYHLGSGGSWRLQGLQIHQQLVGPAKILCQLEPGDQGSQFTTGNKGTLRSS